MTHQPDKSLRDLLEQIKSLSRKDEDGNWIVNSQIHDLATEAIEKLPPPGDVGELVAEIDAAYEAAGWDGEQFDENCIRRPEDVNLTAPRVMEELNSMRLLVNGWPALKAALAGAQPESGDCS